MQEMIKSQSVTDISNTKIVLAVYHPTKFGCPDINVRGIRDQIKRRSIFSFLKDSKTNIYFLQETYSELNDEIIWKNE